MVDEDSKVVRPSHSRAVGTGGATDPDERVRFELAHAHVVDIVVVIYLLPLEEDVLWHYFISQHTDIYTYLGEWSSDTPQVGVRECGLI